MTHRPLFGIWLLIAVLLSPAQQASGAAPAQDAAAATSGISALAERKQAREAELEAIRRSTEISAHRQQALRDEIANLERDSSGLNADLIASADRLRATGNRIVAIERRLETLQANEDAIRRSLHERRDVMAELLMALQRMGRTPPPAILSRPEDALAAIRGSILAGAVLPDIRDDARALADDLAELTAVSAGIRTELEALRTSEAALDEDQFRIRLLVESKRSQSQQTQAALASEREKAASLAAEADNVQSLIEAVESEISAAATAARQAEQASRDTASATTREAARRLADTSRIAPAVHFADAKGLLNMPAPGSQVMRFGDPDGYGGESPGIALATRAGTTVTAPADGWVMYAGPFRSYGEVLILNAGDGYHIVMAGMERIDAALGQFVLAGEPVAEMGETRLASIGDVKHTSAQPILYVEFRKNGTAIDSTPWWARGSDGEVNG